MLTEMKLLVMFQLCLVSGNMELNKECGSEEYYKACQFEKTNPGFLNCRYRKENDFKDDKVDITKSPGAATELNISLLKDTNYFVITWKLPHDGSVINLKGFLVKVKFVYKGQRYELLRTFIIDLQSVPDDQSISQTVFKYPCVRAFPKTLYTVQVTSYPQSKIPSAIEAKMFIPDFEFNVTAEATLSGEWKARIWTTIREEKTLTVCFYGAPKKFSMFSYTLVLRDKDKADYIERVEISVQNVSEADGKEFCRKLEKYEKNDSRHYLIQLIPRGPDMCPCQFRFEGHKTPSCIDSCSITKFELPPLFATDSPEHEPVPSILIFCFSVIFIAIVAAIVAYFFYRFAVSWIKKYISGAQKGKVLIVIVNDMENHVCTALKKHLEKKSFTLSYFDLTNEIDSTGSSVELLSDQIERNHNRYLVVHQAGVKCQGLGESELLKDKILAKSVQKFIKGGGAGSEVCMHSFLLKSGSSPKVILKTIFSLLGDSNVFHPPEDLSDEQQWKTLEDISGISTFLIDPQRCNTFVSLQLDSGLGDDIKSVINSN